jgi:hypothetical protein
MKRFLNFIKYTKSDYQGISFNKLLLRFTDYDYPFGIFKLSSCSYQNKILKNVFSNKSHKLKYENFRTKLFKRFLVLSFLLNIKINYSINVYNTLISTFANVNNHRINIQYQNNHSDTPGLH